MTRKNLEAALKAVPKARQIIMRELRQHNDGPWSRNIREAAADLLEDDRKKTR